MIFLLKKNVSVRRNSVKIYEKEDHVYIDDYVIEGHIDENLFCKKCKFNLL